MDPEGLSPRYFENQPDRKSLTTKKKLLDEVRPNRQVMSWFQWIPGSQVAAAALEAGLILSMILLVFLEDPKMAAGYFGAWAVQLYLDHYKLRIQVPIFPRFWFRPVFQIKNFNRWLRTDLRLMWTFFDLACGSKSSRCPDGTDHAGSDRIWDWPSEGTLIKSSGTIHKGDIRSF